jgi:hypothetical protein
MLNSSRERTISSLSELCLNTFALTGACEGYAMAEAGRIDPCRGVDSKEWRQERMAAFEYNVEVASIYNIPRLLHPTLRAIMAMSETVWLQKQPAEVHDS